MSTNYSDQGRRARRAGAARESCRFKSTDIVSKWHAGWDAEDQRQAERTKPKPARAELPADWNRWFKIPQFPRAHYEIDVQWGYLETTLASWGDTTRGTGGLELSPDYQRDHVWTRDQQLAYVEYVLAGGEVGRNITWNSPDWMRSWERPTELVDGKQRIEAVRSFLRGEFSAFGMFARADDRFDLHCAFRWRVCSLGSRPEVLQLYLNINAGGTPHTTSEIERVRQLLAAEREAAKVRP